MRITEFKEKNVSYIYAGCGLKKVHIIFPDTDNIITVIEGPNGTGKSSLISMLHPFAYNEVDDGRDTSGFILDGKDGYKRIVYDNRYVCEHYYKVSGNKRVVKSYFYKDGVSLNDNGNVTSFKELVKEHLGIQPNQLSLIRLGSNVAGFLDKSFSERKTFMATLMQELNDYIKFYKNASEKCRELQTMLRLTVDKMNKLGNVPMDTMDKMIIDESRKLSKLKDDHETCLKEIGFVENKIQNIENDCSNILGDISNMDISSLTNSISASIKALEDKININTNKIVTMINNFPDEYSNINPKDINSIDRAIKDIDNKIKELELNMSHKFNIIDVYKTEQGICINRIESDKLKIKKIINDTDIKNYDSIIEEVKKEIKLYDKDLKNFKPSYNLIDVHKGLAMCQNIQEYYKNIYNYDQSTITSYFNLCSSEGCADLEEPRNTVRSHMNKLNETIAYNEDLIKINSSKISIGEDPHSNKINNMGNCQNKDCMYIKFYNDIISNKSSKDRIEKAKKIIAVNNRELERYENIVDIMNNFHRIKVMINNERNIIDLYKNIISIKNIKDCLKNNKPTFYDEELITMMISKLEDYEKYNELKEQLNQLETRSNLIKTFKDDLDVFETEISKNEDRVHELDENIYDAQSDIDNIRLSVTSLKNIKEELESIISPAINSLQGSREKLNNLKENQSKIEELVKDYNINKDLLKTLISKSNELKNGIQQSNARLNNLKFTKQSLRELNQDYKVLSAQYDNAQLVKDSVGTKKGLPLYFQKLYLQNVIIVINKLLGIVYNEDTVLCVENFVINDKEFKIPYNKNGMVVDDAKSLSQGERSFVSIALAFALICERLKKYNIIILDEMDSTLDVKNRKKFIEVIEQLLEIIGAEQCFIITHNEQFDNYPVDIITTQTRDNYIKECIKSGKDINHNIIWSVDMK